MVVDIIVNGIPELSVAPQRTRLVEILYLLEQILRQSRIIVSLYIIQVVQDVIILKVIIALQLNAVVLFLMELTLLPDLYIVNLS